MTDEAPPISEAERMDTDEAVRRVREMPDGGEPDTPMARLESNIHRELVTALDSGVLSALGIAAVAAALGYLHGLWVTVDQGHAELSIFLDPAFGVFGAGVAIGFGALFLGYNIGWQADAEVDDS